MVKRKKTPLNEWEYCHLNTGHFIRLGSDFFLAPAVKKLKPRSIHVYMMMVAACAGKREFEFPHNFYAARGISISTFQLAEKDLISHGFITKIFSGQLTREPNRYKFCNDWKQKE